MSEATPSVQFQSVSERPTYNVIGEELRPLVQTGTHELFELSSVEGGGPPPHAHPWNESYVVLEGELVVLAGGVERRLGPGMIAQIAAGVTHCYRVITPRARVLVTTSGALASRFFEDMDAHGPHAAPTPETLPVVIEVARRNQLTSPLFS